MNLNGRLNKLEKEYARDSGGRPGMTRSLKGLDVDVMLQAVAEAIYPAD